MSDGAAPLLPVDSATVVLMREPAAGAIEVLLVARHAQAGVCRSARLPGA
jgi:hypothetical protein